MLERRERDGIDAGAREFAVDALTDEIRSRRLCPLMHFCPWMQRSRRVLRRALEATR